MMHFYALCINHTNTQTSMGETSTSFGSTQTHTDVNVNSLVGLYTVQVIGYLIDMPNKFHEYI